MKKIQYLIKNINFLFDLYDNIKYYNVENKDFNTTQLLIILEGLKYYANKIDDFSDLLNSEEYDNALERIYTLITKIEIDLEREDF